MQHTGNNITITLSGYQHAKINSQQSKSVQLQLPSHDDDRQILPHSLPDLTRTKV